MEFYKLFKRRTNFSEMLEWVDRGYRPEKWKEIDLEREQALNRLFKPFEIINECLCKS